MRCKNCPYLHTVTYEDDYETCNIFGDNDDYYNEDRNGDLGCKYNLKTLDKMYKTESEINEKAILVDMANFVEYMNEVERGKI